MEVEYYFRIAIFKKKKRVTVLIGKEVKFELLERYLVIKNSINK